MLVYPSLPLPCWHFIESIAHTLGKVITKNMNFFQCSSSKCICIEIDLSKDLKDFVEIQIGSQTFGKKVLYLNLPTTCYRCQSVEHKIGDFPLAVPIKPPPKDALIKPAKGKQKEEWTTVGCKGKAPLAPKQSYVVVISVPCIST